MPLSLRWVAILCLLAMPGARAADLPEPWVEFASDGGARTIPRLTRRKSLRIARSCSPCLQTRLRTPGC